MESGRLRHKLVFQTMGSTSDGMGPGGTESWSDTVTVRAERWNVAGAERVEAARNRQSSIIRWYCRYSSSIIPAMRIKWVDRGVTKYQEVVAVNPYGNNGTEMEVLAEEKS